LNKEEFMPDKNLEFYEDEPIADTDIQELMEDEIQSAPKAPRELAERLREHHASSPEDSGGDIDADWEDVNDSGAESVGGHNPTPDQSDVEANAHAMGIDFQDNQPIDIWKKINDRDRDRFELDENSKGEGDMI
jgi:hypothetical protein